MKVLLYTEGLKTISKSGLGKAIKHQMKSLEENKIDYTTNLKDDFDVLHINFYGPKSYFFAKRARKNGKKIVYHAHSTEEDFRNSFLFSNLVSPLFKKWLIKCYSLGDQIITPTEYSKRLLENYNLNKPIHAISNGVETKFFERNEKAGAEFRKTYGYTKKDKVIVGIGLYIERKGILDFVELAKRLPDYKFIWFGYSPLWASPRKIKKAVTTKLPNLHFAGYVDSSMIKAALSGSNLYLFPTLEETEGIPIIEALTSKIPTLIRDIPVFEEYEKNKVVYKAKDIDEFEVMIPKIIEGKLPDLTEEGYKAAKKKDLKIVGKELIKVYEKALKSERKEKKVDENATKTHTFRVYGMILSLFLIVLALLFSTKDLKIKELTLKKYSRQMEYLNTTISVEIYTTSDSKAEKALDKVEDIYKEYDELTSRDEGSKLYDIHHSTLKSEYLTIDKKLYEMIEYGLDWYDDSDGLLNINTGDLIDIWYKYGKDSSGIPTEEELENINIDIEQIELADGNKIKNNNPNINLDMFKRGYANDEVGEYLESINIDVYLLNAGGNVKAGEFYQTKGQYLVGIASPFIGDESDLLTSVELCEEAVSSTGMYQSYYTYDGKTYSHMISPITKYPAENMVGVTVVDESSADAEALATILFFQTIPDGQEFISDEDEVKVMWAYVNSENQKDKVMTPNFYNLD